MWFKNATLYILTDFTISGEALTAALARRAFTPCTSLQDKSSGFVPPVPLGQLVHSLEGHLFLSLRAEKKVLPAAVVRAETMRRAAEFEQQNGHKPGRKMMRAIKDDAYDALLPQAFATSKIVRGWIDTKAGLLVLDTAAESAAELFITNLLRAIETPVKLAPLATVTATDAGMTDWVAGDAPENFTVDQDAIFAGRRKETVRFSNATLDGDAARQQIQDGKRVTSLAMTWDSRVSFVLSPNCVLRRLKSHDVIAEKGASDVAEDLLAGDLLLMAGTLGKLIGDVTQALGGIREPEAEADVTDAPKGDDALTEESDDPMFADAVRIVREKRLASISLVQRHLRIGYNRAARLLEDMEQAGVVSPANASGNRTVSKVEA